MMIISPLSRLPELQAEGGLARAISLLAPGAEFPDLGLADENHLKLAFHDITQEREGYFAPEARHIQQVFDFVDKWDGSGRLLVHCFAGVSRSTAIGYALACKAQPFEKEEEIAARWRDFSPEATPNLRLVSFADAILGRNGRMIAAISGLGRGIDCFEGSVVRWNLPNS